jgi:hypothetical protein
MKTSDTVSESSWAPSLFQIAAFFEDFFPNRGFKPAAAPRSLPIAEVMVNPEKLMTILRSGKETAPSATASKPPAIKRGGRPTSLKKSANRVSAEIPTPTETVELRKVEFRIAAPQAQSVKLAGDFTDWQTGAVPMMRSRDGYWFTTVPLSPGRYSYRYIVDGQWHDDPASSRLVPNPYGSKNAVLEVG